MSGKANLSRTAIQDLGKKVDIGEGEVASLKLIAETTATVSSTQMEEAIKRRKEIAKLVMSCASKSEYTALIKKVKELKNFI